MYVPGRSPLSLGALRTLRVLVDVVDPVGSEINIDLRFCSIPSLWSFVFSLHPRRSPNPAGQQRPRTATTRPCAQLLLTSSRNTDQIYDGDLTQRPTSLVHNGLGLALSCPPARAQTPLVSASRLPLHRLSPPRRPTQVGLAPHTLSSKIIVMSSTALAPPKSASTPTKKIPIISDSPGNWRHPRDRKSVV